MAIVSTGLIDYPSRVLLRPGNDTSATALSASGHKIATLVQATASGTIDSVLFRTATVSTGDNVRVSFQDVDNTTGNPDGTVDQYRSINVNATNTIFETGLITSDGTDTGTKRTVSLGDRFFIVFDFDSYVAGNVQLRLVTFDTSPYVAYSSYFNATSWAKSANSINCCVRLNGTGIVPFFGATLISGASALSIASNTSPDEWANKITTTTTLRVCGLWAQVDIDGDCDLVLYDTDGTSVLGSVSFDKNNRSATSVGTASGWFASPVTISPGTYYVAIKPTTTTALGPRAVDYGASEQRAASHGGMDVLAASRTDAGAWTDLTTRQIACGLLVDGIDVASGGGVPLIGTGGLVY
jgi:hypothetical protein